MHMNLSQAFYLCVYVLLCHFIYLFWDAFGFQPTSTIRAEIDIKLGGTQCNIIMSRLKPWLGLHLSKKKRMVLQEETSKTERRQLTEPRVVMWTCTVSAPEMTILLYSISGSPLYHVSNLSLSHYFGLQGSG